MMSDTFLCHNTYHMTNKLQFVLYLNCSTAPPSIAKIPSHCKSLGLVHFELCTEREWENGDLSEFQLGIGGNKLKDFSFKKNVIWIPTDLVEFENIKSLPKNIKSIPKMHILWNVFNKSNNYCAITAQTFITLI